MSPLEFWTRLEAARAGLRRGAGFAAALAAALVVPVLLLAAWVAVVSPAWERPSPWPLVALAMAGAVASGLAALAVRRWLRPLDGAAVAAAAERARGLPDGSLRGAWELRSGAPAGSSESLARLSERRLVERAGPATVRQLAGGLAERSRLRLRRLAIAGGALALTVVVLGAADPARARRAWTPLLRPLHAMTAPDLPRIEVRPGDARLARGDSLRVSVGAPQRRAVTLHWRARGELPGRVRLPVSGDSAGWTLGPIEAPLSYWVSAPDGARSDTFRVVPLDPLLLASLTLDIAYPAYLGRASERFEGEPQPLVLPEGSVVRVRGAATRPLGEASLSGPDGEVSLEVSGDGFDGRLRPARSGAWSWRLTDRGGEASPAPPPPIQIALVPDEAPWVEIRFPGEDTEVGPDMLQAVVAHAGDDHGLLRAALVSWRVDAAGEREPPVRAAIDLQGSPAVASLRAVLRAAGRRMIPGSRLEYFVEVTDDGPRAQTARSETYAFRFPSPDELRARVGERADDLLEGTDDLSRMASELERATRELQRRMDAGRSQEVGRSGAGRDAGEAASESTLDFERAEDARGVLDQQQALLDQADSLRSRMEELSELSRAAGLSDPEFQERLEEIRDLMDQVAPQEMREQLERLRAALEELDAEQTEDALRALAEQQEELQQRLEQSLDLLQRAAAEQEMRALADEARQIAARQEVLSAALRDSAATAPSDAAPHEPPPGAQRPADARDAPAPGRSAPPPSGAASQPGDTAGAAPEGASPDSAGERREGDPRPGADAARDPRAGEQDAAARRDPQGEPRDGDAGAREQDSTPQGGAQTEPRSAAGRQEELARRAGELSQRLEGLEERLAELGEATAGERSGEAGDEARSGGEEMQEAARRTRGGQRDAAAEAGERGAQSLDRAADLLDEAREAMTQSWRDDTTQALEQATQDALSLAERESELLERMQQSRDSGNGANEQDMSDMRGEQAAVQEGLESISRNLAEAAGKSAMVDRQVGQALGDAMKNVRQSASAMEGGDGRPRLPVQETQAALDAMNELALSLLRNARQVAQSQAGTGLEQALQQLAEAATQQGRVNNEASALSPEDLSAAVLSRQARRLSQRQQDIARQLEGAGQALGGSEDLLGDVEAMAQEAERLAQELSAGRIDRSVRERQEQLFHRMLDAGRSLERDELGDERTSETASAFDRVDPGSLDPALTRGGPRYPTPSSALLQRLSPGYRRLILDYFDLINREDPGERRGSPPSPAKPER